MTSRTKRTVINLSAGLTAILAVCAWSLRDAGPQVASSLNQHWVPRDTFTDFRKDNIVELREIHRLLAVADSERRCEHHQTQFCL
jgi:hypothetical protein